MNPKNTELHDRLREAGIKLVDINELKALAERTSGVPKKPALGDRIVANVIYRDGNGYRHDKAGRGLSETAARKRKDKRRASVAAKQPRSPPQTEYINAG